ncbi:MAG: hypothetical protein WBG32_14310 [Nodosilinea sp.]
MGNDSHGSRLASAPAFASRGTAIDMVERYWMALCRDVPFEQYANSGLIRAALNALNALGFADQFGCTPQTLFRSPYAGCHVGPTCLSFCCKTFSLATSPFSRSSATRTQR